MPYRFMAAGLVFACICFLLVYSIFLKASATLIALTLVGAGVAGGILLSHWEKFVKQSKAPSKGGRLLSSALILLGCFTALAAVSFAVGVLLTGNIELSVKFAGFLETIFLLECTLLVARA